MPSPFKSQTKPKASLKQRTTQVGVKSRETDYTNIAYRYIQAESWLVLVSTLLKNAIFKIFEAQLITYCVSAQFCKITCLTAHV